jgi:diacylglycerol kinase
MCKFFKKRLLSLKNAFTGWLYVIRTQQNAWIHAIATVMAVAVGIWIRLSARDWALIIFVIAMVWAAEFLNTAIEINVDLASPDLHPLARVGKDVGAAAVLIAALSSVIIGILVMGRPFYEKIRYLWMLLGI